MDLVLGGQPRAIALGGPLRVHIEMRFQAVLAEAHRLIFVNVNFKRILGCQPECARKQEQRLIGGAHETRSQRVIEDDRPGGLSHGLTWLCGEPVTGPRQNPLHIRPPLHFNQDLVEPAFQLIVRAVGDQVLTVQFRANLLHRLFEASLPVERKLGTARSFGEQLDRVVLKDVLDVFKDLDHERNEFGTPAV